MYHPNTLSKMAELKRQETHDKYSRQHHSKHEQHEQSLKDFIQNISGLIQRLTTSSQQTTPEIRSSVKLESRR